MGKNTKGFQVLKQLGRPRDECPLVAVRRIALNSFRTNKGERELINFFTLKNYFMMIKFCFGVVCSMMKCLFKMLP